MSNLLKDASILLTPTGYDDGSMNSIKPENGDGDFTFSRNSAATRVNAQGLVENVQIISSELVSNGNFSQEVGDFKDVVIPIGMNIPLPFTIETDGTSYRLSEDFDIKTRANITVNKTYYVDSVSGSNSNNGLTESTPLQTISEANSKGDADRIYLKRGSYFYKNQRPTQISRSVEVIAYGTGDKPVITADTSNQFGSFSQTSNYYSTSAPDYVGKVFDKSSLDSDGQPLIYTNAGSIANVDSTQGSYFWSGGTFYIRTFDDRVPDSSLLYLDNLAYRPRLDSVQYFENIEFFSSVQMQNSSSAGGAKSYFLNCDFKYGQHQVLGQEESIFQNCNVESLSGDAMNIDDRNGVSSNVYEVSSFFSNYKNGGANSQGSTLHGSSNGLSVNSTYTKTAGQCIGDTGTGQRYILGCSLGDSSIGISLLTQNTCWIEGTDLNTDAISIQVTAGGAIVNYKNNTLAGSVDNNGTYQPYTTISGWTFNTNGNNQWTVANEKASYSGTATDFIITNNILTIGKKYLVSFDILDTNGSTIRLSANSEAGGSFNDYTNGDGKYTTYLTANTNYLRIGGSSSGASFSIDNVSVKEITDDTDLPRIDYTGGCGSWLLEPQRTNSLLQSNQFDTTWTTTNSSVTSGQTGVGGSSNAWLLESTGDVSSARITQTVSVSGDLSYSFYAKKGTTDSLGLRSQDSGTATWFNLSSGVVYSTGSAASNAQIKDVGNGWYRCSIVFDSCTSVRIYFSNSPGSYVVSDGANIYIQYSQLELGGYPTSYIPTNGATSTRLQDIATNSGNSTLINSTEGVLYAEIADLANDGTNKYITINNGGTTDYIFLRYRSDDDFQIKLRSGNTDKVNQTFTLSNNLDFNKIAFSYKENEFKIFVNGSQVGNTITTGATSAANTLNRVDFSRYDGASKFIGKTKALVVYKEALTDAQLQSLTTI